MPNIVNPAVAVAAQGGGKRYIHNITLFRNENDASGERHTEYVFVYKNESETPFSAKSFEQEIKTRGFTSELECLILSAGNIYALYFGEPRSYPDKEGLCFLAKGASGWRYILWNRSNEEELDSYIFTDTVREF